MTATAPAPIRPRRVASPHHLAPRPEALPFATALDGPEPETPSPWAQPLPRVAAAASPVSPALGLARCLPMGRASGQWGYRMLVLVALGFAVGPAVAASWEGDGARLQATILALMEL